MRILLIISALAGCLHSLRGQSLEGRVSDQMQNIPLAGAHVLLQPGEIGLTTDSTGRYRFTGLAPGRYTLEITHLGYETQIIPNLWVRNGKITVQDVSLPRSNTGLEEVVVRDRQNPVLPGKLAITEEQINRFATTYYDPARVVTLSPDMAVTNDQNNRVSVRGISPNYNQWRLEGVEIVNPNHLSNAGTFSDEAIATGGSVNIISAQMMGQSSFLFGAYSAPYGNSNGGIFDLAFREGNSRNRQYTAQASLIGLDFSAEGPFVPGGGARFLMNYRYSFTGLLTQMGVDFGGEFIGFQDLSLNMSFPLGEKTSLNVFATGGLNFNDFESGDPSEWEEEKDASDIFFAGRMGATGLKLNHPVGRGQAIHSLAVSGSLNTREQLFYDTTATLIDDQSTTRGQGLISLHSRYRFPLGQGVLRSGLMANFYRYDLRGNIPTSRIQQELLNPYLQVRYPLTQRLEAEVGLSYMHTTSSQALDPRLGLHYQIHEDLELYSRYGHYSQLLNPYNYYFVYTARAGDFIAARHDYPLQFSQRWSTGAVWEKKDWSLQLEGFYYRYPEVRVAGLGVERLTSAQTRGISLVANKNYTNQWYLTAGGSVFDATWQGDQRQYDNRYNTRHNLSVSGGKEWSLGKQEQTSALSANLRLLYQGGLREPLFGESALQQTPLPTRVITDNADFLRLDLRLQYTWYSSDRTHSLALDVQNLTNRQNEFYRYLDNFTGQIETQYQLGLIPILTYRIEF